MQRDEFFWLSKINQATIVINSEQGLLSPEIASEAARAVREVMADGEQDSKKRPKTYITFEPRMLEKAGPEITLMHAGRSSQDMHATYRAAIMRDCTLAVASALSEVMRTLASLAEKNRDVAVPNYTNGVPAQPNSYSHYLLAFLAGFERDFKRIQQFYVRLDRCPMGSTVLNGTGWPLNRKAMAEKLGFAQVADNSYDATQVAQFDLPVEYSQIISSICIHINSFLEDLMIQYAQCRPWILLQEGGENTYVSSAMPQKRNPGLVNNCRTESSTVIGEAQATLFRAHNLQTGMIDAKKQNLNAALGSRAVSALSMFNRVLKALVINKERALEELNSDWTCSQEMADVLMREFGLPFRIGHHVASRMVSFAKSHGISPLNFPYGEMQRIYKEVIEEEFPSADSVLPMSEERFMATLDPIAIINNRKTQGGPQPAEVTRMLEEIRSTNNENSAWIEAKAGHIQKALDSLDTEFNSIGE